MVALGLVASRARREEDAVAEGALRRRRATPRGAAARPSPQGCQRQPAICRVIPPRRTGALVRRRRHSLHLAGWRWQRGHVLMMLGALKGVLEHTDHLVIDLLGLFRLVDPVELPFGVILVDEVVET